MEDEVKRLKQEIDVLKKRIEILEGIERRRKVFKIIKIAIGVIIIIGIILAGLYFYQVLKGYYDSINEIIKNPFGSLGISGLPTF